MTSNNSTLGLEALNPSESGLKLHSAVGPSNLNVVLGYGSTSNHNNCVVIGTNKHSTADNQLIIGNATITISKTMTKDEFNILLDAL